MFSGWENILYLKSAEFSEFRWYRGLVKTVRPEQMLLLRAFLFWLKFFKCREETGDEACSLSRRTV